MNFLAHPGTCGAAYVDYHVVDKIVAPPEYTSHHSERLMMMAHHYQINDHVASYPLSPPPPRHRFGLPPDAVIMCNFNSLYKLEFDSVDVWFRIMRKRQNVYLWLVDAGVETKANFMLMAKRAGISQSRIIFGERADFGAHIQRAQLADIFVDSFTYNAHTTATDVLWGGVPVVTLPGENMQARLAAGVAWGYGARAQVTTARDLKDYAAIVDALVSQPNVLREYREYLSQTRAEQAPLFDTKAWIDDFSSMLLMASEILEIGGRGAAGAASKQPREAAASASQWHLVHRAVL